MCLSLPLHQHSSAPPSRGTATSLPFLQPHTHTCSSLSYRPALQHPFPSPPLAFYFSPPARQSPSASSPSSLLPPLPSRVSIHLLCKQTSKGLIRDITSANCRLLRHLCGPHCKTLLLPVNPSPVTLFSSSFLCMVQAEHGRCPDNAESFPMHRLLLFKVRLFESI